MLEKIIQAIRKAGGRPFFVGGYTRDKFLDTSSKDIDIEVFGLTMEKLQEALSAFNVDLIGKSFGVLHVEGIDISLPRTDKKVDAGHKGFQVEHDPNMSLLEAARRRDFTINALMSDCITGELHDMFGGVNDLEGRRLRHVDEKTFVEDPLRALRALQFACRFGMDIHPTTAVLCRGMDLSELPSERILEELRKFLVKGISFYPHGMQALDDTNMWRVFPELFEMFDTPQDPIHHPEGDVLTHTMLALNYANQNFNFKDDDHKFKIMLAILLHDCGKPHTTEFKDGGRISSIGHAKAGADIAREFIQRFTSEAELIEDVPKLVYSHMIQFEGNIGKPGIRKLSTRINSIDDLILVCDADSRGRFKERLISFKATVEELGVLNGAPPRLVEYCDLGIEINPPPRRGEIVRELYDAQIDGKFNTKEEGIAYCLNKLV